MKNKYIVSILSASLLLNNSAAWAQTSLPTSPEVGAEVVVQTPLQMALQQNSFGMSASQVSMLKSFYAQFGYQTVWYNNNQLSSLAFELKNAVQKVEEHGLRAADYWSAANDLILQSPVLSQDQLFKNDFILSMIYVQIGVQLNIGRVNPLKVSQDIKYKQKSFSKWDLLASGVKGNGIYSTWDSLAPSSNKYRALAKGLIRLKLAETMGGFTAMTKSKVTLKVGSKGPQVLEIKKRLQLFGHNITSVDDNFDENLSSVISEVQRSNLTAATGKLTSTDASTWEYFQSSLARRIQQVEMTMEKLRWLPDNLGSRYLFLNLAVQELEMVDPELSQSSVLIKQKTINGRVDRKTPSMIDKVTHVILNPTWTVPSGILEKDKLPKIRELFASQGIQGVLDYFAHMRFAIFAKDTGAMMDPTLVDWMSITSDNAPFYLRQSAGYENALGIAKFNLGNPYDIYLHDTNERNLFGQPYRLKSSGCIRVQYPVDMAEYFLQKSGWDRQKIENYLATSDKPGGDTKWFGIPKDRQMPIYILSMTVRADNNGNLRFTQDFYKQNAALLKALQTAGYYKTPSSPNVATLP